MSVKEFYENIDTFTEKYSLGYSGNLFDDLKQLMGIVPLCAIKNV